MMSGGSSPSVAFSERPGVARRAILAIAVVGLLSAIGYAFAPVDQAVARYTLQVPDSSEIGTAVVASHAVTRAAPDQLTVTIPCDEPGSEFSSARDPDDFELLSTNPQPSSFSLPVFGDPVRMTVGPAAVMVVLGSEQLFSSQIDSSRSCIARLQYEKEHWDLRVQEHVASAAAPGPWFSEARFVGPAATSSTSSVSVTTREPGSSPSGLQLALGLLAVVCAIVSMSAVSSNRAEAVSGSRRWSPKSLVGSVAPADVAVIGFLVAWLVLLPPQIDEGWFRGITGAYDAHGDFTTLYDGAAPAPLGYWLMWIQTVWFSLSGLPAIMRVLPLVVGVGTWAGLRSIGRSYGVPGSGGSLWLMAAVFVVGFGTFGMTLRPEPIVMALMTASVAIAARFGPKPSSRLLATWAVVAALALSGHPAGVVVLAPLLLSLPIIWRWLSSSGPNKVSAIVHGFGLVTLTVLLTLLDANLSTKLESVRAIRSDGQHGFGILDEQLRYGFLDAHGPTMHRLVVVMMVIAVGALLIRRRPRDGRSEFPARTLAAGLVLLALTPSKWFWHFGGLVPIAALAVAIEFRAVQGWRRIVVLGGMALALGWVWSDALPWAEFDLRTQRWWPGASNFIPFNLTSPVTWIVLAGVVSALAVMVTAWRPAATPWTPVEATALMATGLVIAVTAATFVLDVVRTDGWTYGRQSLAELTGSGDCGLGEEFRIPVRGSVDEATLLASDGTFDADALTEWIPMSALGASAVADVMITPELVQYFRCIDLPRIVDGVVEPPDVMLLTPVIAWQTTFASAALSDDYYRIPVPIPPRGDDGRLIVIVSHEYLTGTPARATHQFEIESG